jgi:hypothetical protein
MSSPFLRHGVLIVITYVSHHVGLLLRDVQPDRRKGQEQDRRGGSDRGQVVRYDGVQADEGKFNMYILLSTMATIV